MIPELPLTLVSSVQRTLQAAVATVTSPFTGTQQVQDWGGEWWEYQIEFATTQGRNARTLSAFFDALGGARGSFLFRDPSIQNAAGLGTPLVNGTGQSGNSLITDGWTAPGLKVGDFFALGTDTATRLYRLTADGVPSGGNATLAIVPKLRSAPADNQALLISSPAVVLRLTSPVPTMIERVDKHRFSINAREAI